MHRIDNHALAGSRIARAHRPYDGGMPRPARSFMAQIRCRVRSFFTDRSTYEAPQLTEVGPTLNNRTKAVISLNGCCGNHGQPGW